MQRHIAQSAVARYGVAVVSVALAVLPARWLLPLALAGAEFLLVAVLITGWVSGLRPALVAWGLATLAFKYYFTPPLNSLNVDVAQAPRLIVFAVVALLMATMSAARRKAEDAGFDAQKTDQLFNAFYTTKPDGTPNPDHGATFHFALPRMP